MPEIDHNLGMLKYKVDLGLKHYDKLLLPTYIERRDFELSVIDKTGFAVYFLIVADLCRFMRERGIRFLVRGSGCGSLCVWATYISHAWLDPIELELPFERFLNPSRVSNPDLDIDIDDSRRHEVVEYTMQKYGRDRVARIGTFGTMGAKAALVDCARALQIPNYQEVAHGISGLIPSKPGVDLESQLESNADLRVQRGNFPKLFEAALRVEGKARHFSAHAAGTIIAPDKLTKFLPLARREDSEGGEDLILTQWDMYDCEAIGLLKMDYLGLKTLRVIDQTCYLINRWNQLQGGAGDFNIDTIDRYDDKAWQLLSEGRLSGVFQVEKQFVRAYAKRMNLMRKDPWQLAVLVALIRPGMLDTGGTEKYLKRASGEEDATPMHDLLSKTLKKTMALMVFQECVMWCARDLSGFSMSEADVLRKGVGKKQIEFITKQWPIFLEGATQPRVKVVVEQDGTEKEFVTKPRNPDLQAAIAKSDRVSLGGDGKLGNIKPEVERGPAIVKSCEVIAAGATKEETEAIWSQIEAHARYSFCNAHAAAYGLILSYQTAYLKAHYPLFYMACLINSEAGATSRDDGYNYKVAEYIEEARSMGITISKPSLRTSADVCRPVPATNEIIFGLKLIKGVASTGIDWVLQNCRGATSIADFVFGCFDVRDTGQKRMKSSKGQKVETEDNEHKVYSSVSKSTIEGLIHAGALDDLGGGDASCRPRLIAMLPDLMELADKHHKALAAIRSGRSPKIQPDYYWSMARAYTVDEDGVEPVGLEQILENERAKTGCFLTLSPFAPFMREAVRLNLTTVGSLNAGEYEEATVMVMLRRINETVCKRGRSAGRSMAWMTFTGIGGDVDAACFPEMWEKIRLDPRLIEKNKVYVARIKAGDAGRSTLNAIERLSA